MNRFSLASLLALALLAPEAVSAGPFGILGRRQQRVCWGSSCTTEARPVQQAGQTRQVEETRQTSTDSGDEYRRTVTVGNRDIHFFDVGARARATGKGNMSGGWKWWDGSAWKSLDEEAPEGFEEEDAQELYATPGADSYPKFLEDLRDRQSLVTDASVGSASTGSGPDTGILGFGSSGGKDADYPEDDVSSPSDLTASKDADVEPDPFAQDERFTNSTLWNPTTDQARADAAILVPQDRDKIFPLVGKGEFEGQLYDTVRQTLAERFPDSGKLDKENDPWYFPVSFPGSEQPVSFYDSGSKHRSDAGLLWWDRDGKKWTRLVDAKPPGMDDSLWDQYTAGHRAKFPPKRDPFPRDIVQAGGGVESRFDNEQGQILDRTWTSSKTGTSYQPRNYYNQDQGAVLADGTRVRGGGYTVYDRSSEAGSGSESKTVFFGGQYWDRSRRRHVFRGVHGTTADGRTWYAREAWWGDPQNLKDPKFDGIVYGDEAQRAIEAARAARDGRTD